MKLNQNSKLKTKTRYHHHKSPTDAEMTNLGYYFSSSSSSSNLSPLAPPFTVERSNPNKLNSTSNLDFNFSSKSDELTTNSSSVWSQFHSSNASQGLDADSIRIATVPDANSTTNPYYYFNMNMNSNSSVESGFQHENQHFFGARTKYPDAVNSSCTLSSTSQPNLINSQSPYNWTLDRDTINSPNTLNWSSMESSIKSGLEPVNQSDGHLFGVKRSPQPKTWNYVNDNNGSGSLFRDYMPSQVDYGLGLSGSARYSRQADGSQGKEDYLLGGMSDIARENNIGPSIILKSQDASFSSTNQGNVSSGFSDEQTITWNGGTSYFEKRPIMLDFSSGYISPSITKSSPSIVIKPSVKVPPFSTRGAVSTNSTTIFNSNDDLFSHKPLKEKGHEAKDKFLTSNQLSDQRDASNKSSTDGRLNFEFKASTNMEVPNIKSSKDSKFAANVSEHFDHPNSSEDSPCWKGAPVRYSSSGSSSEADSSQHPMKKQQKINVVEPEMKIRSSDAVEDKTMHVSVGNDDNLVPTEILDLNVVVKALSNLSQLLLLHSSKDEYGLKENDHKTLADVIHNLNLCVSRKNQQVGPAQDDHESYFDGSAKNTVELQGASLRDNDDLPKDYNMIQKIKRLLDENLEYKEDKDLSSDTLLYKNLWLETEAELCASSYRARFERIKREMNKSKPSVPDVSEVASDKKKVSTSNLSPIAAKLMHEAAASNITKTHEQYPSFSGVIDHIDDVENTVMTRFNILKRREQSNPFNLEEKKHDDDQEYVGNEIPSSIVAKEPHWQQHLPDDAVTIPTYGNQRLHYSLAMEDENVEHAVMARLNILKSRGESSSVNIECEHLEDDRAEVAGKESQGFGVAVGPHFKHLAGKEEEVAPGSGGTSLIHNQFESGSYTTCGGSSDWEYVMKR
ncbi:uncharacterized protein [Rutidosis leptorrhynchoides]|uniref:uncharacterized protein isoform X2 n=1 Tax=Rutidosis leptorrhynchoides TaxID=125765 RepID=UPI003A9A142E